MAPKLPSLTENALLSLEVECCRSALRENWWRQSSTTDTSGPLGLMVGEFLNKRQVIQPQTVADARTLDQKFLYENLQDQNLVDKRFLAKGVSVKRISYPGFNRFLNGKAHGRVKNWLPVARAALSLLLEGTELEDNLSSQQKEIMQRIYKFFFPREDAKLQLQPPHISRNSLWFLSEELQEINTPATVWEIGAELRALAYDARVKGRKCRITRVSGKSRFGQVKEGMASLESTGELSLECLKAGVVITYVYPKLPNNAAETSAESSAKAFRAIAQEQLFKNELANLRLLALDPCAIKEIDNSIRWGGEYLSPVFWWAFYERDNQDNLFVACRPGIDATRLVPVDNKEKKDFENWQKAFISDH